MKKSNRGNYKGEFKEEDVKLVTEQHYKITEASKNRDIHHYLLRRWIKAKFPEEELSDNTTHGIRSNMSRKGDCWDTVAESFFEHSS